MKRFFCCGVFAIVAVLLVVFCGGSPSVNPEFLRIHIRANSNLAVDQEVKYLVKDAVVDAMIPLLVQAQTKEEARRITAENFLLIEEAANQVLRASGFSYTAKARLAEEEFPTRSYDGFTLESGFYDALILDLGSGQGDNWWCVVYPPLCFLGGSGTNGNNIVYKSKILELIQNAKK